MPKLSKVPRGPKRPSVQNVGSMKRERVSWQKAIGEHVDTACLFMAKAGCGCAAPHPLERAPPGATARLPLAT